MSTDEQHELVVQEQPTESPRSDIAILISQAIAVNLDIDKLTKLLEQQHIEEDRQAERAFLRAKTLFQRDCPEIPQSKSGETPSGFTWWYAPLGAIEKIIKPHCAKHGLSYRWTERENRQYCILSHRDGHHEESSFTLSTEGQKGGLSNMTRQQQEGATDTYARGRTLTAVLGIGTAQADLGGAEPAENDKRADPLARTATKIEFDNLTAGWWKFAQPPAIDEAINKALSDGTGHTPDELQEIRDACESDNARREEFDSLDKLELQDLFMAWVMRSIDGVKAGFVKEESPHTFFTVRQITDLWAIINKDKEGKVDVNIDKEEERSDPN